jgi:hypothetical protein
MSIPIINSSGRFVLKTPFVTKTTVIYTVIAVREIADIYIKGEDVYRSYYESVGLVNGVDINGSIFNFDEEVKSKPVIITLEGTDGSITYVPSTYIISYPNAGDVVYSRLVLSADLGAIPDIIPVDSIVSDMAELIEARFGVKSEVRINRSYSQSQPSNEEHDLLEESRVGSIALAENNYSQNQDLKRALADAQVKLALMTTILRENNLI